MISIRSRPHRPAVEEAGECFMVAARGRALRAKSHCVFFSLGVRVSFWAGGRPWQAAGDRTARFQIGARNPPSDVRPLASHPPKAAQNQPYPESTAIVGRTWIRL